MYNKKVSHNTNNVQPKTREYERIYQAWKRWQGHGQETSHFRIYKIKGYDSQMYGIYNIDDKFEDETYQLHHDKSKNEVTILYR